MRLVATAVTFFSLALLVPVSSQDQQIRLLKEAIGDDLIGGNWIYEDIEAGYAKARKSGRPLLVSFRCVP